MAVLAPDGGQFLRQAALDLGFSDCGFARIETLDEEGQRLREWLDKGYHGEMEYMARHFDLRVDPREIVPDAQSMVVLTYNYSPPLAQPPHPPKVARYAYGRDYHKVLKKKLKALWHQANEHYGTLQGRFFVDSGPVLERAWAERAGLGWRGKNTLLIHPRKGSYFFLAVLLCDMALAPGQPIADHCGTCTRCIDACPTDAITPHGYELDASKCISYLTIELKEDIPTQYHDQMEGWVFGCDICQEVCPWNRFSEPHQEPDFAARDYITEMTREDWFALDEDDFRQKFQGSPLMRAGYSGITKNLKALYGDTDQDS